MAKLHLIRSTDANKTECGRDASKLHSVDNTDHMDANSADILTCESCRKRREANTSKAQPESITPEVDTASAAVMADDNAAREASEQASDTLDNVTHASHTSHARNAIVWTDDPTTGFVCPSVLPMETRDDIRDCIASQAGNEYRRRVVDGGYQAMMDIDLQDGSEWVAFVEVVGEWDYWYFLGAKQVNPPTPADDEPADDELSRLIESRDEITSDLATHAERKGTAWWNDRVRELGHIGESIARLDASGNQDDSQQAPQDDERLDDGAQAPKDAPPVPGFSEDQATWKTVLIGRGGKMTDLLAGMTHDEANRSRAREIQDNQGWNVIVAMDDDGAPVTSCDRVNRDADSVYGGDGSQRVTAGDPDPLNPFIAAWLDCSHHDAWDCDGTISIGSC